MGCINLPNTCCTSFKKRLSNITAILLSANIAVEIFIALDVNFIIAQDAKKSHRDERFSGNCPRKRAAGQQ
jgi:hypothetical protein